MSVPALLVCTAVLTAVSSLQNQRGSSKAGSGEAGSHAKAAALVYRWAEEGACRGALVDPDPDCPPANQHPGEQWERSCSSSLPWPAQAFPARAILHCCIRGVMISSKASRVGFFSWH